MNLTDTIRPGEAKIGPIGPCAKCGRDAGWNHPTVPANDLNGRLWCDRCSDDSPTLRRAVEQRTYDGKRHWHHGYDVYCYQNVTLWIHPDNEISAWYRNGGQMINTQTLKSLFGDHEYTPFEMVNVLWTIWTHGVAFCTVCHEPHMQKDLKFYPFAGAACPRCFKRHNLGAHHALGD